MPWHFLQNEKRGWVRKLGLGWREKNRRKPSIDAGAGFGSCPWAKINSPWQWDKMLKRAPGSSRSPKSQLCWSNEPGVLRGLGAPWLWAGCVLCRQFIETGLACLPHPSRLGLRAIRSAGGAARWTSRAISGREEKLDKELWEPQRDAADKTIPEFRRGSSGRGLAGWTFYSGISIIFKSPGSSERLLRLQKARVTCGTSIWLNRN